MLKSILNLLNPGAQSQEAETPHKKTWKLWQVESSFACNLRCVMCPWHSSRPSKPGSGHMGQETWQALRPLLNQVETIDLSGGGEPLMQPRLIQWVEHAAKAGCQAGFLTNALLLDQKTAAALLDAGVSWMGFSLDGATAGVYQGIRQGSDFNRVCANIAGLAGLRGQARPRLLINFVMMQDNIHQVLDMVRLAKDLRVDQVNFKQCDVIRGKYGKGFGLFAAEPSKQIRRYEKIMKKARKLGSKLGIKVRHFGFVPDETPVCRQDPSSSVFVRWDGVVAPCIGLAYGGPSTFLGQEVDMPQVHFGALPRQDIMDLWQGELCRAYQERFKARVLAHDKVIARSSFEPSLIKLRETFVEAQKAMPPAPPGCEVCHYLHEI
jgi:MoaA/NifB/PqqE/SkfB family radical SAM enzyme